MMETPILETERLILRPFLIKDTKDVFEGWENDEDVAKYMFWTSHNDIKRTEAWIKEEISKIDSDKWYRWAIVTKEDNKLVGTCLIYFEDEYNEFEVSYNLSKKAWGHGYTTEAMKEAIWFAEDKLNIKKLMGRCAKVNQSSAKIMKKLGFKFSRNIPYECECGQNTYEGEEYILYI